MLDKKDIKNQIENAINYELLKKIGSENCTIVYNNDNELTIMVESWDDITNLNNHFKVENIDNIINIVFSDEYATCNNCSCLIELSTYGIIDYFLGDGFICCKDCTPIDDYIEQIENNPSTANTLLSHDDLINQGYVLLDNEYRNGLYIGDNDNPTDLYNSLKDDYESIIFNIINVDMFTTEFDIYVK